METTFKILALVCALVAVFFFWQNNIDAVFVTAVIGAVCFFLSIRFEVKRRMDERAAAERERSDDE